MCALLRYSSGGLVVLLTTAYIAASADSGISAFRPTVIEPAAAAQTVVNRMNKGNREVNVPATTAQRKQPTIAKEPKILEGCDPAFSPLMSSAKKNYANRCLA
jgi:P pilus assembly chaperone PapD